MAQRLILVALLAEGVDRNVEIPDEIESEIYVALLAEGVDRNVLSDAVQAYIGVALLAEGVDRNRYCWKRNGLFGGRPPRGGRG